MRVLRSVRKDQATRLHPTRNVACPKPVNKWIRENDKILSTATWLKFDIDAANRGVVVALRCSICKQFCDKLVDMRNYNSAYVEGSSNLRSSSFKDHASTEMHAQAMQLSRSAVYFTRAEITRFFRYLRARKIYGWPARLMKLLKKQVLLCT